MCVQKYIVFGVISLSLLVYSLFIHCLLSISIFVSSPQTYVSWLIICRLNWKGIKRNASSRVKWTIQILNSSLFIYFFTVTSALLKVTFIWRCATYIIFLCSWLSCQSVPCLYWSNQMSNRDSWSLYFDLWLKYCDYLQQK